VSPGPAKGPVEPVDTFAAGRYNHAFAGPTQYLSLHPLTPWAELLRNEDRTTRERALLLRYPLWVIRVVLAAPPQVLDFETAPLFGLKPEDLVADDQTMCRELADRLRTSSSPDRPPPALLVPSAALPGTVNLVVLAPRVLTSWTAEPVDELDWPGSLAARDGCCPEGLWEYVHALGSGAAHAGLAAWREGREHRFREPLVTAESLMPRS
jgi:RES domain-containing protein